MIHLRASKKRIDRQRVLYVKAYARDRSYEPFECQGGSLERACAQWGVALGSECRSLAATVAVGERARRRCSLAQRRDSKLSALGGLSCSRMQVTDGRGPVNLKTVG